MPNQPVSTTRFSACRSTCSALFLRNRIGARKMYRNLSVNSAQHVRSEPSDVGDKPKCHCAVLKNRAFPAELTSATVQLSDSTRTMRYAIRIFSGLEFGESERLNVSNSNPTPP